MQIAFANWIWAKNSCEYQIGASPDTRISNFKVDYVIYLKKNLNMIDGYNLTADKIESIVIKLREAGISFINTIKGHSIANIDDVTEDELIMK
jgi:hypothetical protein